MVSLLLDTEPMGLITGSSETPGEKLGAKRATLDSFEVPTSAELLMDRQAILRWNPLKACFQRLLSGVSLFSHRIAMFPVENVSSILRVFPMLHSF